MAGVNQGMEKHRWSWGFFDWEDGKRDGSFVRLMDYSSKDGGSYAWVADPEWYKPQANDEVVDPLQPISFYHGDAASIMQRQDSDFMLLQWRPNMDRPHRPFIFDSLPKAHASEPDLYEVVRCTRATDGEGLRRSLQDGIVYQGRPANHVLITYGGNATIAEAAVFDRSDLVVRDGRIHLSDTAPDTVASTRIHADDIGTVPPRRRRAASRYVYRKASVRDEGRKVCVKPLSQYAQSYLEWFIRTAPVDLSEQGVQEAKVILELLFEDPGTLEEFLGTEPSERVFGKLRRTLEELVHPQADRLKECLGGLLAREQVLMDAFRAQAPEAYEQATEQLQQRAQAKLKGIEVEQERRLGEIRELQAQAARLVQDNDALRKEQEHLKDDTKRLEHDREEMRQLRQSARELQEHGESLVKQNRQLEEDNRQLRWDIDRQREALQREQDDYVQAWQEHEHALLGQESERRAAPLPDAPAAQPVAQESPTGVSEGIRFAPLYPRQTTRQAKRLADAIAGNLRTLGLVAPGKDAGGQAIASFSQLLVHTLGATRLLCVDQAFAYPLANALSFALDGIPAQHAGIPSDWSDMGALDMALDGCETSVLVLDNVLDTLNETVLFALGRRSERLPIIIVPLGSYANVRLLAPEAWHRMFLVPTEGMAQLPATDGSLYCAMDGIGQPVGNDEIRVQLAHLMEHCPLDAASLSTVAAIRAYGQDSRQVRAWTLPHLYLYAHLAMGEQAAAGMGENQDLQRAVQYAARLVRRIERG